MRGDSISNTGNGQVLITDINPNGDNNEDALICCSETPVSDTLTRRGNWYLHPTQMSINDSDRIAPNYTNPIHHNIPDRGWLRNRAIDSGRRIVRLRRAFDSAEEGVFTCNIPGDSPRYLGIYYPSE